MPDGKKTISKTVKKWQFQDKKQEKALLFLAVLVLVFVFSFGVPRLMEDSTPVNGENTEMAAGELAQAAAEANVDVISNNPQVEISKEDAANADEFFDSYRLERSKVRGQQLEMLEGIVNNEKSSSVMRDTAQKKIVAITSIMEAELLLENILSAKYGGEAVVFLQDNKATVVLGVAEAVLPEGDAEQVARLVTSYTQVPFENVVIMLEKV